MSQDRGLPCNVDAERLVLGSILLDDVRFPEGLNADAFSVELHRRIWRRMSDLHARGEKVDRITLANELLRHNELDACGGLSYLVSLDDGLPEIVNLENYIRILRELGSRRRIIFACQHLMNRAGIGSENLDEIIAAGQDLFGGSVGAGNTYRSIDEIPSIEECGTDHDIEYVRNPELPRGSLVALTGDSGSGKSTLASAWIRDCWRKNGIPSLILDRENPRSVVADRLRRLGMQDGPGIRWWGGWLAAEAPGPESPIVRAWAKEHRGLVVVDSFSAFLTGDQNDAAVVRSFLHQCRRLADLGATVIVVHHDGKAETSKDYRGSSDFKAAIDAGYHVANYGGDGRLDKLVLRPFKNRFGLAGEFFYQYADGQFLRGDAGEAKQTVQEQLTALLRMNPGVTARRFDDLANDKGLGRNRARAFLADGILAGSIRRESGAKNQQRHYLVASDE